MEFGTILMWRDDAAVFRGRISRAEALGFGLIGVGDSPNGYRELEVSMTVAVESTTRAKVASMVAVPVGRHPANAASALSALQELSGGRIVCGIGTGASAAAALGRAAFTLPQLGEYVKVLRALLHGESATWEGDTIPALHDPRPVPILLSAYGPAGRRLAGRSFDGVVLPTGASVPIAHSYMHDVRSAAEKAGRDPRLLAVWVMSRAAVRDSRTEALADIKANLASAGAFGLKPAAQVETVPADLRPALLELQRRYDATEHVVWDGPNARLLDELGLTDYLAERFAIAGTPDECRAQAAGLEAAGVTHIVVPAVDADPDGLIERFAGAMRTP